LANARNTRDAVISFGSPKEAALYFDKVFPIDLALPLANEVFGSKWSGINEQSKLELPFDFDEQRKVLNSLTRSDSDLTDAYGQMFPINSSLWMVPMHRLQHELSSKDREAANKILGAAGIDPNEFLEWAAQDGSVRGFFTHYRSRFESVLEKAGLRAAPTWSGAFEDFLNEGEQASPERESNYLVAIKDLEMIDVSRVSWDQVVAFRSDPDHMRSLRDFRVYFSQNYDGKSQSEVRDMLEQAIDNQREAARFWGFETIKKTFAVATREGNVAFASLTGIASSLAGAPLSIAAIAGASIPIGSCALEFTQLYIDERKARLSRPLRYLTKLGELSKK